jgi:hypothetical protein
MALQPESLTIAYHLGSFYDEVTSALETGEWDVQRACRRSARVSSEWSI